MCDAKLSFYRTANEIFGKIGRFTSEEVTLQLIQSKCTAPVLLYGLDACPLNKTDTNSLYFVVNQFFMKLFCASDINVVHDCQLRLNFKPPNEQLQERKEKCIDRYEVWAFIGTFIFWTFIRSTPASRPSKAGLDVRPSIRTPSAHKKFLRFE